jgi:hypothetical protein
MNELTIPHTRIAARVPYVPTTPEQKKPLSKAERKRNAWRGRGKGEFALSAQQLKSLNTLYTPLDERNIVNPFSLSATLVLYPSLADAYIPDEESFHDSQLAFEQLTNAATLWRQVKESRDEWQ